MDGLDASAWSAALDSFEDASIYQTWAYGAVRWGSENLSHLTLSRGSELVAVAQLRIVRVPGLGMGIAYLRWGPLCHRKGEALVLNVVQAMAAALRDEYVQRRGLFLRLLPNAFQGSERAAAFEEAFTDFTREEFRGDDSYRTLVLNLDRPLDEIRKALDQKWRNQLNRAEKNGLGIIEGEEQHDFEAFHRVHEEMWSRKQYRRSSSVKEFAQIQKQLPPGQRMRVFRCELDGKTVAAMIATAMGNTGIYLFGATGNEGLKAKGSYLLQWRVIQWLKERGIRHYNLGGINPVTNPGVYHFKTGLSGADVLYMNPLVNCQRATSLSLAKFVRFAQGPLRRSWKTLSRQA